MKKQGSKHFSTVEEALEWAVSYFEQHQLFFGHGTDNAWDEAVFILSYCINKNQIVRKDLLTKLTDKQYDKFCQICKQRVEERMPAAYLVGETIFAGLTFYVNEHVLIPRSPLGELIENDFEPWLPPDFKLNRVLDLCTGSGCIGIAIAHYFESAEVTISDISEEALMIARKNCVIHDVQNRVQVVQSDLYEHIEGTYDLIISNPPYVSYDVWETLPDEYKHEPELAFVADNNGLALVTRIVDNAYKYLNDDGVLLVEVGEIAEYVDAHYPNLPMIWLEFEKGGEGVFMLEGNALKAIHRSLN